MFGKKKTLEIIQYNKEKKMPVLRCSICNGEQVAGLKDRQTGAFEEIMFIRNAEDLAKFREQYGITDEIEKIY